MGYENSTHTYTRAALDRIKATMITASAIITLALLIAFYYVCWQVLSTKSHAFVVTWSLISTTLVIVGTVTGAAVGLYFGLKQSDVVLGGIKLAISEVIHAAEQVSEVRVMTLSKYQSTPERKGGQEWMVDRDLFGVIPASTGATPNSYQSNGPPIDVPADSTGRAGE